MPTDRDVCAFLVLESLFAIVLSLRMLRTGQRLSTLSGHDTGFQPPSNGYVAFTPRLNIRGAAVLLALFVAAATAAATLCSSFCFSWVVCGGCGVECLVGNMMEGEEKTGNRKRKEGDG